VHQIYPHSSDLAKMSKYGYIYCTTKFKYKRSERKALETGRKQPSQGKHAEIMLKFRPVNV
jgi:hypothetical protein